MGYSSNEDTTCPVCRTVLNGDSDLEPIQELVRNNRKLKKKVKFEKTRCSFYMRQHLERKKEAEFAQKRLKEMETSNNRRIQELEEQHHRQIREMQEKIKALIPVIKIDD